MRSSYIAIDLKSFYASVECVERGLDPLGVNLVVADNTRTDKTICLAVSPPLKAQGVPGRPRLFEVLQKVQEINARRRMRAFGRMTGSSVFAKELSESPRTALDFITAVPQMSHYMRVSAMVYAIYLKYIAPEDIHVYSVDEAFLYVTPYLAMYRTTPQELATLLVREIYETTGITATAGIGTNLYLCKVAMDIVAKHAKPDRNGARIGELDEHSYRELLWTHTPLTDFWRIGPGYAKKLAAHGIYTMGDTARISVEREDLLYDLFGINAELLIDHAWGVEPCTMEEIKSYRPQANSVSTGQVLPRPYANGEGALIVREMCEVLALDLVGKKLLTDQIVLTVCYDNENLLDPELLKAYRGEVRIDHYGRFAPKHAHGTRGLGQFTASASLIAGAAMDIYRSSVDPSMTIRRVFLTAGRVLPADRLPKERAVQLDLFGIAQHREADAETIRQKTDEERRRQETVLAMQRKYGKNAILKGMNFLQGGTTRERNEQIGGHRA